MMSAASIQRISSEAAFKITSWIFIAFTVAAIEYRVIKPPDVGVLTHTVA